MLMGRNGYGGIHNFIYGHFDLKDHRVEQFALDGYRAIVECFLLVILNYM